MLLRQLFEKESVSSKKLVVVYGGRFQPFHRGHYHVYLWLCKKYGKENVWIATSNKTNFNGDEGDVSPFNFEEKKEIITTLYDIEPRRIIKCKNPTFSPVEVLEQYKGFDCIYLAAVGEKDKDRYRDSKFFDPLPSGFEAGDLDDLTPMKDGRGYFVKVPMKVDGVSGTEIREKLPQITDEDARKKAFKHYFTKYDSMMDELITAKLKDVK